MSLRSNRFNFKIAGNCPHMQHPVAPLVLLAVPVAFTLQVVACAQTLEHRPPGKPGEPSQPATGGCPNLSQPRTRSGTSAHPTIKPIAKRIIFSYLPPILPPCSVPPHSTINLQTLSAINGSNPLSCYLKTIYVSSWTRKEQRIMLTRTRKLTARGDH